MNGVKHTYRCRLDVTSAEGKSLLGIGVLKTTAEVCITVGSPSEALMEGYGNILASAEIIKVDSRNPLLSFCWPDLEKTAVVEEMRSHRVKLVRELGSALLTITLYQVGKLNTHGNFVIESGEKALFFRGTIKGSLQVEDDLVGAIRNPLGEGSKGFNCRPRMPYVTGRMQWGDRGVREGVETTLLYLADEYPRAESLDWLIAHDCNAVPLYMLNATGFIDSYPNQSTRLVSPMRCQGGPGGVVDQYRIDEWRFEMEGLTLRGFAPIPFLFGKGCVPWALRQEVDIKQFIRTIVEELDKHALFWVLGEGCSEYWSSDETRSAGRHLALVSDRPVAMHMQANDDQYLSDSWYSIALLEFGKTCSWEYVYTRVREVREKYSKVVVAVIEGPDTAEIRRSGLAAAFAGASGVLGPVPPGLLNFMSRLSPNMTAKRSGSRLFLDGDGLYAEAAVDDLRVEMHGSEVMTTLDRLVDSRALGYGMLWEPKASEGGEKYLGKLVVLLSPYLTGLVRRVFLVSDRGKVLDYGGYAGKGCPFPTGGMTVDREHWRFKMKGSDYASSGIVLRVELVRRYAIEYRVVEPGARQRGFEYKIDSLDAA